MRSIWNGKGELANEAHWYKDAGDIVGRPYIRRRASSYLSRWRHLSAFPVEFRRAAIRATVDNDEWMARRNGETVGSILRQVEDHMLSTLGD